MMGGQKINTTILDSIIIGRVDPKIYAFTTGTVPNYLKVGDTYRPLETRLDEWRVYFPNLEKKFDDIAKIDNEIFFRDYAVHYFLESELGKEKLKKDEIKDIPYYSQEFFKGATKKDIENAIKDIKESYKNNKNKYQYYNFDESRVTITHTYERTADYGPRPNQERTIEKFKKAVDAGRNNLLMYAVMRFGKSFTSMCCAVEIKSCMVLIVSAKADVKEEWKKTVESHEKFRDFIFLDNNKLLNSETVIKDNQKEGKKIVVFLTLQDLQGKEIKKKHKEVFTNKIDLLIIDETHFGARAEEYGKVLRGVGGINKKDLKQELKLNDKSLDELENEVKTLDTKIRLHLSGTPYRILMGSEFEDEDIIAFYQFSDIAEDQKKWDKENLHKDEEKEWNNPYYGFPQMVRFAFHPNESSRKKMEELKSHGVSYTLSELFKPQSITKDNKNNLHKKFIHEAEVLDLFKVIDGSKEDENILNFLDYEKIKEGKMCRHIVCVLPYRASCDALEALLKSNKFKNLGEYNIINISGVDGDKNYKTTQSVQSKIKDNESKNQKTITLTVNRMLTGSTVPEWDTMLYFKDTASPQEYDQAVFRIQNQYVRTYIDSSDDTVKFNMKPQTLLVDFSPNRMFEVQEQKALIYNANTDKRGGEELKKQIQRELDISPIIVLNKNKIQKITPSDILDTVRDYSKDRGVDDEARAIPIDIDLLDIPEIRAEIERQNEIGSKQGLEISVAEGEGSDIDVDDLDKEKTEKGKIEKDLAFVDKEAEEDFRKKFATYYMRVLFFAFLTNSQVESLQDIIQVITSDKNNQRIITNLAINTGVLTLFQKHVNPFAVVELDRKIHNINSLSNDKDIQSEERAKIAMKKFTRLSESEVVTPEFIAGKMIDSLPEKEIKPLTKILDIASKQGEFVYSVYKKFGKKIANNVYSIPTSKAAYEFTRKIYESLGLNIENIEKEYTSYQLIEENEIINGKNVKINGTNMKFDIIVGNPPYQINDGGGTGTSAIPLYNKFVDLAKSTNPDFISMIIPSRWFSGGKGLDGFREKMLSDKKLIKLVDYFDSSECFPNVDLSGGVCYFLWSNMNIEDNCEVITIRQGAENRLERPLLENEAKSFIRFNEAVSVLRKIQKQESGSFIDLISARKPFGDILKKSIKKKRLKHMVKVYAYPESGFIKINDVGDSLSALGKYKVFISKAYGERGSFPYKVIAKPFCGERDTCCSETYLMVGPLSSRKEAENIISYMTTRFFRFLVLLKKSTQNAPRGVYEFVPIQDFSETWTDEKLYKKYKLIKKEIEFIENNVKHME